jgi:hypothetical protein
MNLMGLKILLEGQIRAKDSDPYLVWTVFISILSSLVKKDLEQWGEE